MNRRSQFLLAGAAASILALIPLVPVSAQTPDKREERHMQRDKPQGGGEKMPHGAGGQQGAGGAERHQGGGAVRQNEQAGNPGTNPNRGAKAQERGARPRVGAEEPAHAPGATKRADETPRERKSNPNTPPAKDQPARVAHPERVQRGDERRNMDNAQRHDTPAAPRRAGDDNRKVAPHDNVLRNPDPGAMRRAGPDDGRRIAPDNKAARDRDRDAPRRAVDETPRHDDRRPQDTVPPPRRVGGDGTRPNAPADERRPNAPALGLAGGFLAPTGARRLDDLRRDRREVHEGDRTIIREPGRTIVQNGNRAFIVHDENDRFRALGLDVRRERRGNEFVDTINRPDGVQILTFTDVTGRLLRRVRRTRDGREFVLIDNGVGGHIQRLEDDVVVLPAPQVRIPHDRYVVDYRGANVGLLYDTLIAPPLVAPPRRYTLDQVRYSPDVRNYVRSVDINTINFDSGSWDVPASATGQLEALGTAIKRAVDRDPNSVFLVEGYTDATGNADDNLSLSDRRAQSVAEILTKDFGVPPENLTTQGYGEQNPKENTSGPSAANRRVVVQNITQLLASGDAPAQR